MSDTALEAVLRRDRAVVIVALAVITALAWADLVWLAGDMAMGGMDMTGYRMIPAGRGLMMPADAPWQPIEFGYVFVMWVVMMIGMMMPSAAPMILIYARVGRQAAVQGKPFASSGWFAGGYPRRARSQAPAGSRGRPQRFSNYKKRPQIILVHDQSKFYRGFRQLPEKAGLAIMSSPMAPRQSHVPARWSL